MGDGKQSVPTEIKLFTDKTKVSEIILYVSVRSNRDSKTVVFSHTKRYLFQYFFIDASDMLLLQCDCLLVSSVPKKKIYKTWRKVISAIAPTNLDTVALGTFGIIQSIHFVCLFFTFLLQIWHPIIQAYCFNAAVTPVAPDTFFPDLNIFLSIFQTHSTGTHCTSQTSLTSKKKKKGLQRRRACKKGPHFN